MEKVKEFDQNLKKRAQREFLNKLPKVCIASKAAMEADLTLEELQSTMKNQAMNDIGGPESAPGFVTPKMTPEDSRWLDIR